jgi:hypothetical protein
MQFGVSSGSQLAWKINDFKRSRSLHSFIAKAAEGEEDVDAAVEECLGFLRTWMEYRAPQMLGTVERIQRSVLRRAGLPFGDYSAYAVQIENLFRAPPLVALEEYGIPIQVAERLTDCLEPDGDLDALLGRLAALPEAVIADLHAFEQLLVREALAGL